VIVVTVIVMIVVLVMVVVIRTVVKRSEIALVAAGVLPVSALVHVVIAMNSSRHTAVVCCCSGVMCAITIAIAHDANIRIVECILVVLLLYLAQVIVVNTTRCIP
jgi:hypothetical protein